LFFIIEYFQAWIGATRYTAVNEESQDKKKPLTRGAYLEGSMITTM